MMRLGMVLMLALAGLTGSASAAPAIYCGQPEWDFGTISDALSVTNQFLIENRGESSLLITDVKSVCNCTVVTLKKRQLSPGDRLRVTAVFDPAGRSGKQHKSVRIFSTDPKTPVLSLQLNGQVDPQLVVMPSAITFIARSSDKMIERAVTLSYDRPVKIKSVEVGSDAVTFNCSASASARSHVINVFIDPARLNGRLRTELIVESDHPSVPLKSVPVLGRIK